jgi:hypothetical protein
MTRDRKTTIAAVALVMGAAMATPALAIEPDVDSPAGPELPAPRYDRPDFQFDDQAGAPRERDIEGTDRLGAAPEIIVPEYEDDVPMVPPPALPQY